MNLTESNLISLDTELKQGQRWIRIGNSIIPVGVGGVFAPSSDSSASTGAADFYKCASVSSASTETYYVVTGAGSAVVNGEYHDSGNSNDGYPVYIKGDFSLFYSADYECWFLTDSLDRATQEDVYAFSIYSGGGQTGPSSQINSWEIAGSGESPVPTVTENTSRVGSNAWTGYKAVQDPVTHVYSFMPTVTTGLTYSVVTPVVGKVYTDGALVKAELYEGIPINGMVVLISGESLLTAETGQTMTATQSGLDLYTDSSLGSCLNFFRPSQSEDGGRLDCATGISSADSSWSFSTWIKRNSDYDPEEDWYNHGIIFGFSRSFYLSMYNSSVSLQGGSGALSFSLTTTNWNHVSLTCSDNTYKLYVNGILSGTTTGYNAGFSKNTIFFGRHPEVSKAYGLRAYLKSIRLYDRDLAPAEITALATEFTPAQE